MAVQSCGTVDRGPDRILGSAFHKGRQARRTQRGNSTPLSFAQRDVGYPLESKGVKHGVQRSAVATHCSLRKGFGGTSYRTSVVMAGASRSASAGNGSKDLVASRSNSQSGKGSRTNPAVVALRKGNSPSKTRSQHADRSWRLRVSISPSTNPFPPVLWWWTNAWVCYRHLADRSKETDSINASTGVGLPLLKGLHGGHHGKSGGG